MIRGLDQKTAMTLRDVLSRIQYPARRLDLVRAAKQSLASDGVVDALRNLPDLAFNSIGEVERSLANGKDITTSEWSTHSASA